VYDNLGNGITRIMRELTPVISKENKSPTENLKLPTPKTLLSRVLPIFSTITTQLPELSSKTVYNMLSNRVLQKLKKKKKQKNISNI
jgi:hypothetical protein